MIEQVNVFIENQKGRLASVAHALQDAGVNMHALIVADTSEYGVVRIICDAPSKAVQALSAAGNRASKTKVLAVKTDNVPGGFSKILDVLESLDVNVEYAYCFGTPQYYAVSVVKTKDSCAAAEGLRKAGFCILEDKDLYAPDEI